MAHTDPLNHPGLIQSKGGDWRQGLKKEDEGGGGRLEAGERGWEQETEAASGGWRQGMRAGEQGLGVHAEGLSLHAEGLSLHAEGLSLRAEGLSLCGMNHPQIQC